MGHRWVLWNERSVTPEPKSPDQSPSRPCPICGKPLLEEYQPFCSKRCADVDLYRWLGGAYAVPADPAADDEENEI